MNDLDTDIQHVGCTAIPGLCAKPVLNIDIIIETKSSSMKSPQGLKKSDISIKASNNVFFST